MFDIGFLELILIAIIGLLVLGPERLPVAARTLGRWVGKARRMASTFSKEIDRQLEIEELKEELKQQGQSLDISEDTRKIQESVNAALEEAKGHVKPITDEYKQHSEELKQQSEEFKQQTEELKHQVEEYEPLPRTESDKAFTPSPEALQPSESPSSEPKVDK